MTLFFAVVPYTTSPVADLAMPSTSMAHQAQFTVSFGSLHAPSSPANVWLAAVWGQGNRRLLPAPSGWDDYLLCLAGLHHRTQVPGHPQVGLSMQRPTCGEVSALLGQIAHIPILLCSLHIVLQLSIGLVYYINKVMANIFPIFFVAAHYSSPHKIPH